MQELDRLKEIVKTLREPGGCAWDREQTIESLKPYVIEEAYEVVEAIYKKDDEELCEELGDLLTQIVFISRIAEEEGRFELKDVCNAISEKLIRRHPHVFTEDKTEDTKEILKNWERIKTEEKGEKRKSLLDDIPRSLPSVVRAFKMQKRMSRVGFDWKDHGGAFDKMFEELNEIKECVKTGSFNQIEEEFGDLMFSIINAARFFDVDCESALQSAINKVDKRFRYIEEQVIKSKRKLEDLSLEEMDKIWDEAKGVLKPEIK
jgi:MazG family protein